MYPVIGSKRVDLITNADVMAILTPIWVTTPTTAKRVRQRISAVMAWAVAEGHRGDDPAGSAITKALPKTNGPGKNQHLFLHRKAAEALRRISTVGGHPAARLATQFAILTAARSGEVRGARWEEIDQQVAVWTIPTERMKAGGGPPTPPPKVVNTVFRLSPRLSGSSPRPRSTVTRPTLRRSCSPAPGTVSLDRGNCPSWYPVSTSEER